MFNHAEVKEQHGVKVHSMFKVQEGDVAAEKDTYSLDFGPAQTVNQGDNSLTLWGPGVQVQETPSSILTQSLHAWRKDNAHLPAAKAAEELEKLYANLPPEALELTFQDMIGRPTGRKEENRVQSKISPTNSNRIKEEAREEVVEDVGQVQRASKAKQKKGSKVSRIATKFATLLAMKPVLAPNKSELSHAQLDELVEKRRKTSKISSEGLYSASTSFRRVSPLTSRNGSRLPSPSASFNMLQIDKDALEREIARSARYFEACLGDHGGEPTQGEQSPRRQGISPPIESHMVQKLTTRVPNRDDCSTCPTTNLFFLKTTCQVCGKSFCPSCKKVRTKETRGVRRCRNSCRVVDKSAGDEWIDDYEARNEEEIMKKVNSCWTIGLDLFIRVKRR